jgi:hypothetical protein
MKNAKHGKFTYVGCSNPDCVGTKAIAKKGAGDKRVGAKLPVKKEEKPPAPEAKKTRWIDEIL